MKRRFVVTLLAVAIAVVGSSAFALAPTIDAIASPVIADDTPVTNSNIFVYPDALDLDDMASDPDDTVTSPGGIIWSYTGTGRYRINDRDPIDLESVSDDPNAPGAKEVGAEGLDDPASVDSNVRTITFRDSTLSPVSAPEATDPATSGVIHNEVVTLFASDGSSWSMRQVMVYTENNGIDRLSSSMQSVFTRVPGTGGTLGWISDNVVGSLTFSDSGNGLCVQAPLADNNFGSWISPYDYLELTQNQVYRVRITVDAGGTTIQQGATPLWDFVLDNFDHTDPAAQELKFAGSLINLDNEGGANAVSTGVNTFDLWWAPMPVASAEWNSSAAGGQFTPEKDAVNDIRMQFRIQDVISALVDGENDAGTLCLSQIQVSRIDYSQLNVVGDPLYEVDNLSASTHSLGNPIDAGTSITYPGGNILITPPASGWSVELINIDPGNNVGGTPENPSEYVDNFPVVWESDQLLMGTVQAVAPNANAATNPVDVLQMAFDTPTTELLGYSLITSAADTVGMPDLTPVDYKSFYYTHNGTVSGLTNGDRVRLRFNVLCNQDVAGNPNTGGIQINSMKVEQVELP